MKIKYSQILILTGAIFLFGSCGSKKETTESGKIKIVTTVGMIKDVVENVAGDNVEVIALMGPGVDPHLYKATQGDLDKLTSADIVFYGGLHLEGKMGEVLEKLGHLKPVIAVSSEIPDSLLRDVPGFQGTHDPHIWFDVKLWEEAVKTMSNFLQKYDSANRSVYQTNTEQYLTRMDSLHETVKTRIAEIPKEQRVLITAHDAFGYFGDAYGIEVKGLQGISRKIKAIFVETSVSEKSINAVVEGCKQKGWDVKIGGSLFSDAMGAAGTPEGNYIGMVSKNVETIVTALK
jgi:manganese/zinc/iron transport system substrate-binding protein